MRAEDILPGDASHIERGGMTLRKGTVAAFLANAAIWLDPAAEPADVAAAEAAMIEARPALEALALFDILAPRDPRLGALMGV
ncbi:MAG: hypothetical protein EOP65_04210 [Sphingomonas sp.]|jgi:hypothetical protein|nr:MAG: hypothetical protein EOP65_04210 [Sphingomonas sp.]